jgi:hypothetical protein
MGQRAQDEAQVDFGSLDQALGDLLKAATATDLNKAGALGATVAIDSTGHHDERGDTDGGYPDQSDVGVLDSMMVGKMQNALVNAGFDVGSIAAFMHGKAENPFASDDDEEEDEEEEQPQGAMRGRGGPPMGGAPGMPPRGIPQGGAAKIAKMEAKLAKMRAKFGAPADTSGGVGTNPRVEAKEGESAKKSMDAFAGDPAIADAIDVSPFLSAIVQQTTEAIDGVRKSMRKSSSRQEEKDSKFAMAIYEIGRLVKSQAQVIEVLNDRLHLVERTPAPPKGVRNVAPGTRPQPIRGAARPMSKALPSEAGGQARDSLTKSEVINTLSYMNLEKGIKDIGGQKTGEIAMIYEGGGTLSPQALQSVYGFLQANPHLAQQARNYR